MIEETPEPEDQEQPSNPTEEQSNNPSGSLTPDREANQAQPDEQGSDSLQQIPIDEREDDGEKLEAVPLAQEEAAHQHERLEQRGMWQEEVDFQRQIKDSEAKRTSEAGKRNVSLTRLGKDSPHIHRVNRLFVEPEGYQEFVEQITERRILIVSGHERSGKFTTAVYLAQYLWQQKGLEAYKFVDRNKRNISEIISDEQLPRNAVILFDGVFDTREEQIKLDDLIDPLVDPDNDLASLPNVWFIFTVLNGPVQEKIQGRGFPILSTKEVNRQQVLEKLIDYFFPPDAFFPGKGRTELLTIRERVNPSFTPPDLYWLFYVNRGDPEALIDALTQKEALEGKEPPHIWFHKLQPMNYQLYALLVVLFDKLDMPTLEEIYTGAVHALRRQGMDGPDEFIDPRRIGTDLMHTALGIQVSFNNVLEFRSRLYRQYVENQVENFQRLLWSLIDPDDPSTSTGLIGLLHRLSEQDRQLTRYAERDQRYVDTTDQVRQLRAAIAIMIAQVGVYHFPRLDLLLDKLVRNESALVALTAAQVLAEIARRGTHFEFIEKLLNKWCQSGSFDQKWIAVASISYIYDAIARTLEAQPEPSLEEDELDDEEAEEHQATRNRDQKQRRKGQLARLRDILTELAETHDFFSERAIDEEKLRMFITHREHVRELKLADVEPITDDGHLFRDLSEEQQRQYIYSKYKSSIDKAVQRDIKLQINSWKNQMCLILVQTLGYLVQMWPRDITQLVRVWIDRKDTQSQLWQVGHMALNYLFWSSTRIKDASLLERSAYPLLNLLPLTMRSPVLTIGTFLHDMQLALQIEEMDESGTLVDHLEVGALLKTDPLITALDAIQKWYENLAALSQQQGNTVESQFSEEDEEEEIQSSPAENALHMRWQQRVYTVLSNAMNSAAQQERQRLRRVLFLWTKSEYQMLNRIARILISHSYVMDGGVLDLPSSQRAGIVVIDSNRSKRDDREVICYLLQNLSAIVPIHIHWLGYTRHSRFLSSDNRDEQGKAGGRSSFGPDDLLLRGARRPSLLLPVLTSGQGKGYTAEQAYFVAVFHSEQILDLADLYQSHTGSLQDRRRHEPLQRTNPAPLSQTWRDKVYLLPSTAELTVPAPLSALLTVVDPENLDLLEEDLKRKITLTLRACPAAELWRELQAYIGTAAVQPPAFERLTNDIERWLQQLSDTSVLYPDVSLFILWTIMIHSRENLAEAIQLIEGMLQERSAEREDKATKRARKLRQQMGIACTRMLFHLYGVDNPTLAPDPYSALLTLLPQIVGIANSYSEILPILPVLFQLAATTAWLQILNESDGALFECLNKIPAKDIDSLRNWLKRYQLLAIMSQLFVEFNHPFNDFLAKCEEVQRRSRITPTRRGEVLTPDAMDSKFLAILPTEENEVEQARYNWALRQIKFTHAHLRNPGSRFATLTGLKNREVLLNHLMNACQNRLAGVIERLKQGEYYGVVMVESQSKTAAQEAFMFVQEFVKQRRQGHGQHITLMVQRLGEKEVLAKVRNNRKLQNAREISDRRNLPLVMGPLLERYPADQVDFVMLITTAPVTDYDDWVEQDQWASRLWVGRLGKWYPYRGEIVALKESTPLTLETILQRSGGGIEIL